MKRVLLVLVLLWGSSFLAYGQCQTGQSLSILETKCPCGGAKFFLNVCVREFGGPGCDPAGQQQICGVGCNYTAGLGCISGGPRIQRGLLVDQLALSFKKDRSAILTCSNDGGAFERWLNETSSTRRPKAL